MELNVYQAAVSDGDNLFELTYTLLERNKYIEDVGEITVFGITAEATVNGKSHSRCKISDISPIKEKVSDMLDKLCRGCVFPQDMIDVVLDLAQN